jgi:hypothetical protein
MANGESLISWWVGEKSKYLCISLRPYIHFYISRYKTDGIVLHFSLLGYPFRALIGIDTAHLSHLYPIHSLLWFRFTKRTSDKPMNMGKK